MIAEFAMKFLTSERSITTVKPRPKRITLAEFARLKLLGATEMAAQPSTLTLQREENVATRVAAAMPRFRQCRPAHSSKCASGANFSVASRGRNPKIVDLFAGFKQSDQPPWLLAATRPRFGRIVWISVLRDNRRVRPTFGVYEVWLCLALAGALLIELL
jgi:hypothetical protein